MAASRISRSDSVFRELLKESKEDAIITHIFLKKSQDTLDAIKLDLNAIFGFNIIELFNDDKIIQSCKKLDDLIQTADAYLSTPEQNPYSAYVTVLANPQEREKQLRKKIYEGLASLYSEMQLRVERLKQADASENAIFNKYNYPKTYGVLSKKPSNTIEKAIAIFDDYKSWPRLRLHQRAHIKSAKDLSDLLKKINSQNKTNKEKEMEARACIMFVKNNLIGRGELVVDADLKEIFHHF